MIIKKKKNDKLRYNKYDLQNMYTLSAERICSFKILLKFEFLGNSIWIPHTPCERFKEHLQQQEGEFQVDKLIWHF